MSPDSQLSPSDEYQPGDTIAGRYVLAQKLGEGGMGVVWIAQSVALGVDVALKLLRRELAGTQAVERMAREAQTAAQLGHPAMVRALDFGTTELGEPFLAMELLEGEELHSMLVRERRLAANRAVGLLLPVIDGLGTAHDKGIVHRDLKPENIFVARDGQGRVQPKVLDFGIAKLEKGHFPSRLTQVGAVLGSPLYLSPEQAEGLDDVDFRSDIWSIGVVLYELITGRPPFEANNYNALIRSILRDNPQPTRELEAGDAQLWTIIDRCLRKQPEQRWGSMWELGEALALWLFERGERVDAASRSLKHGWLDGGITGLQILVTSEHPGEPTLRPADGPPVTIDSSVTASASADLPLEPQAKHPRFRRARILVAAGVGLTLVWLLVRGIAPHAKAAGAAAPAPRNLAAEEVRKLVVPPGVVTVSPVPTLGMPASSALMPPASSPTTSAPARKPPPTRSKHSHSARPSPVGAARPNRATEFGF